MSARQHTEAAIIADGFQEYVDELQEELDAAFDEELSAALDGPVCKPDGEDEPLNLDLLAQVFGGGYEFFMDGNHPGYVYYCTQGSKEACMQTVISEGGNPFGLSHEQALADVIKGDDFFGRWDLHECPDWWYEGYRPQ